METNGLFEAMARIGETITLGSLPEGLQKMVRDTVELERTRDYGRIMQMRENYFPEREKEEEFKRTEFVMLVKGSRHSELSAEEMEKSESRNRKSESRTPGENGFHVLFSTYVSSHQSICRRNGNDTGST